MIRYIRQYLAIRRLNRLVREARSKLEASKVGRDERGRFVSKSQWRIG